MKKLSFVLPVFNEASNIECMYEAIKNELTISLQDFLYEIIFIDDGSKDTSWSKIIALAKIDKNVKALSLSRNFGHQMCLTAGYDYADGDAIISMDTDLQDPPSLIPKMVENWKKGTKVVYARRKKRCDSIFKRITAILYYHLLSCISDVVIPRNVGDFRLIDKEVLSCLKQCREKSRYLRGIVAWCGFTHKFIDFERPNRYSEVTGYTWSKMIRLAFDGVTGFSLFPLKIAAFSGLFVISSGTMMFLYITYDAIFYKTYYPLFKWLVTIIYIFMGVQFLLMWLLGEYIGRVFEQQKGRPLYIVKEKINF